MLLSKEERVRRLVDFIHKVKYSIKIEAGELNPEVYNNPQIADALKNISDNVNIKIQLSPIICVSEDGKNTIIELWKKKRVKLYLRKVRGDKIHRWIGDDCLIFSEGIHNALDSLENRQVIDLTEEQERYWANKACETFESRIDENEVAEVLSDESIILLSGITIKKIIDFFADNGEDYNYKTGNQIEEVRKNLGLERITLN